MLKMKIESKLAETRDTLLKNKKHTNETERKKKLTTANAVQQRTLECNLQPPCVCVPKSTQTWRLYTTRKKREGREGGRGRGSIVSSNLEHVITRQYTTKNSPTSSPSPLSSLNETADFDRLMDTVTDGAADDEDDFETMKEEHRKRQSTIHEHRTTKVLS